MVMLLGSASRAAAALHISQPAVTQLLQQMEGKADLRLFGRSGGKLIPTSEAHALFAEVERVYQGMDAIQRKIVALRSQEEQVLRIGSLHAMASSLMPKAVAQFQRSYPRIKFHLRVDSSRVLREALIQGDLDLAYVGDEVDTSGLDSSNFYELPAVCVMLEVHPFTRKSHITGMDLRDVPLVGLSSTDTAQKRLNSTLRQIGIEPRTIIETPYSATQCALVLAGAGLALTNPLVAREYAGLGLRSLPFVDGPSVFRALLAFRPRQAQSRLAQAFVSHCRSLLATHQLRTPSSMA